MATIDALLQWKADKHLDVEIDRLKNGYVKYVESSHGGAFGRLWWGYRSDDDPHPEAVPDYSTEFEAALNLLGELPFALSSAPTVGWEFPDLPGLRYTYRCEIVYKPDYPTGYADTPALAVCRAWLEAVKRGVVRVGA